MPFATSAEMRRGLKGLRYGLITVKAPKRRLGVLSPDSCGVKFSHREGDVLEGYRWYRPNTGTWLPRTSIMCSRLVRSKKRHGFRQDKLEVLPEDCWKMV